MTTDSNTPAEISVFAGQRPDGESVFEQLAVIALDEPNCYRVKKSPAFSKGLAKNDEIRLLPAGHCEIIKHSGNLCIRVFAREGIDRLQSKLAPAIKTLAGSLDVQNERMLVYSIPVSQGFSTIEDKLNESIFVDGEHDQQSATWLYGNVYDPADGNTPLNWWQEFLTNAE